MSNQTNKLAAAFQAFQQRDYATAQRFLKECDPGVAAHLSGLVERRLGHFDEAVRRLEHALQREPDNHEIHHNQALVWLDMAQPERAIDAAARALELNPKFVAAQNTYGRSLREAGRWAEAKAYYTHRLTERPDSTAAHFGLGSAELELGEAENAHQRFSHLIEHGVKESAVLFMHGRAALEAGYPDIALKSLLSAHETGATALTLRELGRLYWMLDRRDEFNSLVNTPYDREDMRTVALELLRLSGADPREMEKLINPIESATADQEAILAQAFVDSGNAQQARSHAKRALSAHPKLAKATTALISSLLMEGQAEQALDLTREMQKKEPDAQQWIAYEATALRVLGNPGYKKLIDIDHHVQTFSLPVPSGFASIDAFNEHLLAALDRLQLFDTQPVDQSLRLGTQTARDLCSVNDVVIKQYLQALDEPIRQYMQSIGTSSDHPLSRRNTGDYRLSGCWSVRLTGGGHHVNHMHPQGWISSAYYAQVPTSSEQDRSGWIKFSEPPFKTQPTLAPERWIRPEPGMLVLFPSYLWHGTEPIIDGAVRVTAPFDAVPV